MQDLYSTPQPWTQRQHGRAMLSAAVLPSMYINVFEMQVMLRRSRKMACASSDNERRIYPGAGPGFDDNFAVSKFFGTKGSQIFTFFLIKTRCFHVGKHSDHTLPTSPSRSCQTSIISGLSNCKIVFFLDCSDN
jgi:hypothetical protein